MDARCDRSGRAVKEAVRGKRRREGFVDAGERRLRFGGRVADRHDGETGPPNATVLRPAPHAKSTTRMPRVARKRSINRSASGWGCTMVSGPSGEAGGLRTLHLLRERATRCLGKATSFQLLRCSTIEELSFYDRPARRPAGIVLLSEGRYAGLHQRGVSVPRSLQAVRQEEGADRRRQPRHARIASKVSKPSTRFRLRCWPTPNRNCATLSG